MADGQEEPGRSIQRRLLLSSDYLVPSLGLLAVHVIFGCFSVTAGALLSTGVDPLFYVVINNLAMFIFLSPFAACLERSKWPERVGAKLAVHLLLLSVGGVSAFQILVLMGLQRTSPAIASATNDFCPGLVFVIACLLRFEKFDVRCRYSITKAMGTLLCLSGVIAMTLLQNGSKDTNRSTASRILDGFVVGPSPEWITGCVYLILGVLIAACTIILQASALRDLPAPLSLTAITSLMGAVFTALIQLLSKGKLDPGTYTMSTVLPASCILLMGTVTSTCHAFQMWCIRKQGPVFVSMFNPVGTVVSAVLSTLVLGKFLSPGSLAGVVVMIFGLYIVLWAKMNERTLDMLVCGNKNDDVEKSGLDNGGSLRKPLLS